MRRRSTRQSGIRTRTFRVTWPGWYHRLLVVPARQAQADGQGHDRVRPVTAGDGQGWSSGRAGRRSSATTGGSFAC